MRQRQLGATLGGLSALLVLVACVPLFVDGLFQSLSLAFRLDRAVAAGEERLVHTAEFAEDVKVKKSFIQLSGRLTAADGEPLPERLEVEARIVDPETGKLVQRIALRLPLDEDGSFRASTRIRKNIGAGEVMTVTLEPAGADLAAATEVVLCVDMVKKRGELALLPDCLAPDEPDDPNGGGAPTERFAALQNDFLTPSCARVGCHDAGGAAGDLVLVAGEAYSNLVDVPSSQRPQLDRVEPGDPEGSYLIKKLRGDADISGNRMPRGGPFLSDAEIGRFVRWIQEGALDN